jgi:hypothetical protein
VPFLAATLLPPGVAGIILLIAAISAVDVPPQSAGGISEQICLNNEKMDLFFQVFAYFFLIISYLPNIFHDLQKRLRQSSSIPPPSLGVFLD